MSGLDDERLTFTYRSVVSGELVTWTRDAPDRWVTCEPGRTDDERVCPDYEAIRNILLDLEDTRSQLAAVLVDRDEWKKRYERLLRYLPEGSEGCSGG